MKKDIKKLTDFEKDVKKGLTDFPKKLSSKYFYDEKGDALFQDIMSLPEYYLTRCEFEILSEHTQPIAEAFRSPKGFDLIELGAGDGEKTKILLKHLVDNDFDFTYLPVDISENILNQLKEALHDEFSKIEVKTLPGTYFNILKRLADYNKRKKVILMLGSNIGNLYHEAAVDFLTQIQEAMSEGDLLFMGFDQKKNPNTILSAYNDSSGVTEAFNKNILKRINRELEADFDLDSFLHWPSYNPETGVTRSFLVSKVKQEVNVKALDLKVSFEAWESIHTEISQKYDDSVVEWLAGEAGLIPVKGFSDKKGYYKNYIFKKA